MVYGFFIQLSYPIFFNLVVKNQKTSCQQAICLVKYGFILCPSRVRYQVLSRDSHDTQVFTENVDVRSNQKWW